MILTRHWWSWWWQSLCLCFWSTRRCAGPGEGRIAWGWKQQQCKSESWNKKQFERTTTFSLLCRPSSPWCSHLEKEKVLKKRQQNVLISQPPFQRIWGRFGPSHLVTAPPSSPSNWNTLGVKVVFYLVTVITMTMQYQHHYYQIVRLRTMETSCMQ